MKNSPRTFIDSLQTFIGGVFGGVAAVWITNFRVFFLTLGLALMAAVAYSIIYLALEELYEYAAQEGRHP